jgi:hypothetical protein
VCVSRVNIRSFAVVSWSQPQAENRTETPNYLNQSFSMELNHKGLPDDFVFDILTQLPVKSLIRFRCVSKSFNSTITSPLFITTHFKFNQAKSLSNNNNHNGFLLYASSSPSMELCRLICNNDNTLSELSRIKIPFSIANASNVCFCNGMFCFAEHKTLIYLWNPSIRKFKKLEASRFNYPRKVTFGLAYHSQNNDLKILRIVSFIYNHIPTEPIPVVAQIYTLSTDSWRKVDVLVQSLSGNIIDVGATPCLFFNGALHSIAYTKDHTFILSFDVNDEKFREIMLPQDYLDEEFVYSK